MNLHYSQTSVVHPILLASFTTLWIYTILKPRRYYFIIKLSFTTLWIYTILKQQSILLDFNVGFTTLWIYTILKLVARLTLMVAVSLPYGFTLFSNR